MIYPFVCKNCSHNFEIDMTVAEYSATDSFKCPECLSEKTQRTFHSNAVVYNDKDFTKFRKGSENEW